MAPSYLGLFAVLAVLMVKFLQEDWHFVPSVLALKETDVILVTPPCSTSPSPPASG